ncbi:MAG TPA: 3-methyl-2-oxobutanoate dehydrogenase subunit VorB [Clostridia bacterium]|nr:3-methyl-2-oxobutanoate dehydrogenase subunit VorB [Clostridia bacterium]
MAKMLMKGNEAVAQAAIRAGCDAFFGYPITPQNEVPEYLSRELPKAGGVFVQAESEVAAINMVYGAAGAGARVMTSSSSPGISLKQEGISYIAGAELPAVIVNMVRGGSGLGSIQASQCDYYQATRGGGNGDYRTLVYAPANVQEAADLVMEAFDVADYYRNPVVVLGDGMIGQMMEPVEFRERSKRKLKEKTWAASGTKGKREHNVINSLRLDPEELEVLNDKLQAKYEMMEKDEARCEMYKMENPEIVFVAYGTTSRIVKNAIDLLEAEGITAGLIRPITLYPFPKKAFDEIPETAKGIIGVEMSEGQIMDDIEISNKGRFPTRFYGRAGGVIPKPKEIVDVAKSMIGGGR